MNKERIIEPIERTLIGIAKNPGRSILLSFAALTSDLVSLERAYQREFDQAYGLLIAGAVVMGINLYKSYKEGGRGWNVEESNEI